VPHGYGDATACDEDKFMSEADETMLQLLWLVKEQR